MSNTNGTANGVPPPPAQSMRVRDIVHNDAEPRDSAYFSSDGSSKRMLTPPKQGWGILV